MNKIKYLKLSKKSLTIIIGVVLAALISVLSLSKVYANESESFFEDFIVRNEKMVRFGGATHEDEEVVPIEKNKKVFDFSLNYSEENEELFDLNLKLVDTELLERIRTGEVLKFEFGYVGLRTDKIVLHEFNQFSFDFWGTLELSWDEEFLSDIGITEEEELALFMSVMDGNEFEIPYLYVMSTFGFIIYDEFDIEIESSSFMSELIMNDFYVNGNDYGGDFPFLNNKGAFENAGSGIENRELEYFLEFNSVFKKPTLTDRTFTVENQENSFIIEEVVRYDIVFKNIDGSIIHEQRVKEGLPISIPENPNHPENTQGFEFTGWDPEVDEFAIGDAEYTAIFREKNKYTVKFINGENIHYEIEVYEGETFEIPENPEHENFPEKYYFIEWEGSGIDEPVNQDLEFRAIYDIHKFTVEFYDDEGKLIEKQEVEYGNNATEPNKNLDKKDRWFVAWDVTLDNITEDRTITGIYELKDIFTINFKNIDGSIIQTLTLYDGDKITAPRNLKHPENEAKFKFTGWNESIDTIANRDIDYTAVFEINKFTVKFLDLKGKTISTQVVEYGESAIYPEFEQETIDKILTGWEGEIDNITSNQNFKATFETKDLFFITFKNIDGSIIEVLELYKGQPIKAPIAKFISDNELFEYVFTNWDKELDEVAERNIEYTAQYELTKRFRVIFKNSDGSIILEEIYLEGDLVNAPKNIEHPENSEKYKFIGWDKEIVAANEDTTYTSVFEINKYTVKFLDLKGKTISTQIVEYGESATYPDFEQETIDRVLTGWEGNIDNITSNQTFKASFEMKELFFITFKNIDGSIIEVLELYKGQPIKAPIAKFISDNELKEYVFKGWNEEVDEFAERNVEYTAEYDIVNKYRITFENVDGTIISEELYVEGDKVNAPKGVVHPENPEKYRFVGWDSEITNANENKTYIAQFEINTFTVSFYDNDNKLIERQTVLYGENANHPERELDKFDRYFVEWDSSLENITENKTINAVYEMKKIYTYTFLNYDKSVIEIIEFYEGQEVIAPEASYKSGQNSFDFIFSHWNPELQEFATQDATYEAFYDVIEKYKIIFKDLNGEIVSEQLVLKGEMPNIPELEHPTEDHKFIQNGWDKEVIPADSDQVYEVRYRLRTFTVDFYFSNKTQRVSRQVIEYGSDAIAPKTEQERFTFVEWDSDFTNVTENIRVTGIFEENEHVLINFFDTDGNFIHSIKNYGALNIIDLQREYSVLFDQQLHKFGFDISAIYEIIIVDEVEEKVYYEFDNSLEIEYYREYNFIVEYEERELHEVTIVLFDGTEIVQHVYDGYFPEINIPAIPDYKFYGFIHNDEFLQEEFLTPGHVGIRIYEDEKIRLFYTDNSPFYKEIEIGKFYEIHDIPNNRTWLFKDLVFEPGNYHFIFKSNEELFSMNETRIVNIVISEESINMMIGSIAPTRQKLLQGTGYFVVNSQTTSGDKVTIRDINFDLEIITFLSTYEGQFSLNEGHVDFSDDIDETPDDDEKPYIPPKDEWKFIIQNIFLVMTAIILLTVVYKFVKSLFGGKKKRRRR